jgi:hypothetical protein
MPWEAKKNENWARTELGETNKINKSEFKEIISSIKKSICLKSY